MVAARILIVANDVMVRRATTEALREDGRFTPAGVAPSGKIGIAKLTQIAPDGVLLDPELTNERAHEVVAEMRSARPDTPIVLMVAGDKQDAPWVKRALDAGAEVAVRKPDAARSDYLRVINVFERIFRLRRREVQRPVVTTPELKPRPSRASRIDIVSIGSSTGGPRALEAVIQRFSGDFPVPIVITQHMPPVFTRNLALQLDRKSAVHVREAAPGDLLDPGTVYIAPGDFHMEVVRRSARFEIQTHQGPPENSCRPAVDVMMRSVIKNFGAGTLSVILTGMGQDGLRGCQLAREAGGPIYVQDEASSVVWGMPGFVAKAGLADKVLPLGDVAQEVERRVWIGRERPLGARERNGKKAV